MDKNKEESNPTDGTQWLEAYRQEKEWGEPHQWRLEELTFIKLELQTFFADEEKNQIPQEKLNQISEARRQMPRALYSPNLIEKKFRFINISYPRNDMVSSPNHFPKLNLKRNGNLT